MRALAELEELRDATFESLMLPFVAIAMDVRSGEELLLDTGPVLEGTRPSFAMPGIFPSYTLGQRVMVDGAMVNPGLGRPRARPGRRLRDRGPTDPLAAPGCRGSAHTSAPGVRRQRPMLARGIVR